MKLSRVSEATKKEQHRGEGHGANYKPYIKVNEFNSLGTTCNPIDWKTGRTMELMSQGEMYLYYLLRWNDNVVDIREQFPLELESTLAIADELGIKHPKNRSTRMTSDLLVDYADGHQEVYSVKRNKKEVENSRTEEKLKIEQLYWNLKGIPFYLTYTDDLNLSYVTNIRLAVEFYNKNDVFDEISQIKHLIATKQLQIDLSKELIDYGKLREEIANGEKVFNLCG